MKFVNIYPWKMTAVAVKLFGTSAEILRKIVMDLLAIQQKSLDRALFLYIFIHEIRLSGVRVSITIVHIRRFDKM